MGLVRSCTFLNGGFGPHFLSMKGEMTLSSGTQSITQDISNSDVEKVVKLAHGYVMMNSYSKLTSAFFNVTEEFKGEKYVLAIDITEQVQNYGKLPGEAI